MIPRTLNALLSLVGLMRIAEHEEAHSELKRRLGEAEQQARLPKGQAEAAYREGWQDGFVEGYSEGFPGREPIPLEASMGAFLGISAPPETNGDIK